jgi:sulfite exporter TauE/SafE
MSTHRRFPLLDLSTHGDSLIFGSVLMASLLGSGHCAAMCGGLVIATANTRSTWVQYHLGRLVGYLGLGAFAGWAGSFLFQAQVLSGSWREALSWVSVALLCVGFLLAAIQAWRRKSLHIPWVPQAVTAWLYARGQRFAGVCGILTALLPCGWLHSFVLASLVSQSAWRGAGMLFVFWIGTLPILGLTPWVFETGLGRYFRNSPRLSAVLFLVAAGVSVGMKMNPLIAAHAPDEQAARSCH